MKQIHTASRTGLLLSQKALLCLQCLFAMVLPLGHTAAAAEDMSAVPLPTELKSPQMVWGGGSNGFRAGLCWGDFSGKMDITVLVLTFKTNTAWRYVVPPGKKFMKLELRDARGTLLPSLKGKELDGELPQRILTKDLPHSPPAGIHNPSMIEDWLTLAVGLPGRYRDFFIEDAYRIRQDGDYTLTVWAAIYEFASDRQSVSRIDLPPVTAKIHLSASVPSGLSPRATTAYVAGAALCVAGVVWLVAHRRRRLGENAGPQTAKAVTS
jgi:hypothetical protein